MGANFLNLLLSTAVLQSPPSDIATPFSPDSLAAKPGSGIAYERLSDALRYDRVQGLSLGIGYRVRMPGVNFTTLHGTVRYGLSDERVTGQHRMSSNFRSNQLLRPSGRGTGSYPDPPHG